MNRPRLSSIVRSIKYHTRSLLPGSEIAVFHEFFKPPYGGGNQFLLALKNELNSRGIPVSENFAGRRTVSALFNSFNFDFARTRAIRARGIRIVHRVDGPVSVYRGGTPEAVAIDRRIWDLNRELADATIFQSQYSLSRHRELGMEFVSPVVIPNSINPAIFHSSKSSRGLLKRPVHVVATAWSSHPNKGLATFKWLDENLDPAEFRFTFVGRVDCSFKNAVQIGPQPSWELAEILRGQDIYLTASEHEACSNAVIEALACGLPVVYKRSGSNPELVGEAGLPFDSPDEIPGLLRRVAENNDLFREKIRFLSMREVADRYLQLLLKSAGN